MAGAWKTSGSTARFGRSLADGNVLKAMTASRSFRSKTTGPRVSRLRKLHGLPTGSHEWLPSLAFLSERAQAFPLPVADPRDSRRIASTCWMNTSSSSTVSK
jgi:hypothetical protein